MRVTKSLNTGKMVTCASGNAITVNFLFIVQVHTYRIGKRRSALIADSYSVPFTAKVTFTMRSLKMFFGSPENATKPK